MTNKDKRATEEARTLDPSRLWTFEEAKYYLRVGDSTLRNYLRTGRLPAVRVGGDTGRILLFRKADLDALLVPVVPGGLENRDMENEDIEQGKEE